MYMVDIREKRGEEEVRGNKRNSMETEECEEEIYMIDKREKRRGEEIRGNRGTVRKGKSVKKRFAL